jgi:hypothetical protein
LGVAFHGGIIPTEVEGHTGYVGVNGEGRVVQGDRVPKDSRMMEKEDAEQASEEERKKFTLRKKRKYCMSE